VNVAVEEGRSKGPCVDRGARVDWLLRRLKSEKLPAGNTWTTLSEFELEEPPLRGGQRRDVEESEGHSPGWGCPVGEFVVSSILSAKPDAVWRHAVSPSGVNHEFRPLLRMTFPAGIADLTAGWQPGKRVFRSWLLLGGLLPVDYDDVVFAEVEPGRRFLERSSLLSQRVWDHERRVESTSAGCRVTDRVRFQPRLAWLGALYGPLFKAVFRWRHRNLRGLFGTASA